MRWLRWTSGLLVLAGLVLIAAFLWWRQAGLPQHAGRVALDGIATPVSIVRDAQGIATVTAASEADALTALGFIHAQDRLWQMEFNRRLAAGRLAEVLGAAALPTDRFLRTLGVQRAAQRLYEALDGEQRALVDAYLAGINGYLSMRRGPLPPEFLITGTPAPAPWTAADALSWSLMMAWDLSAHSMRMELRRLRLARQFTRAEIDDIYPPLPGAAPPATADYVEMYRLLGALQVAQAPPETLAALPAGGLGSDEALGSNNWVLAGARTVSGKPLLANDPHLGLSAPSVWYFVHLNAPGLQVAGATLPGLPAVVLGRNPRIAWGMTNTGADQQDLYLERLSAGVPDAYDTPQGPQRFSQHIERIAVKGQADHELVVRETRHGPVLSGLEPIDASFRHPQYVLALRWAALDPGDRTLAALRALNRAGSVAQADAALADFNLVTQSVVLADVDGNIGFVVAGRIPLRRADNDLLGVAPAPGWDERYDWQGWLPYAEAPRIINPSSGVLASANNRVVAADYPHHLTFDWFASYRVERIHQLLAARAKHDVASMQQMQADLLSQPARQLVELLRDAQPLTTVGRDALARLLAWDGTMRAERPEPLLFHAWRRELSARVFSDDFGPLAAEFVDGADLTRALLRVLRGEARARDWCDDRRTPDRYESCRTLMSEALDSAATRLTQDSGRDVAGLRWGDAHMAVAEHRPLSSVALLGRFFELATAYPGDTYTLNVGALSHRPEAPFSTRHAASLRAIHDLAAPEGSHWILSTGQAGNPFSSQYASMLPLWRDVDYLPLRPAAPGVLLELVPR